MPRTQRHSERAVAVSTPPEKISRFNRYRGYSAPAYDSWHRISQYVVVRDGTRIAVDYFRPATGGVLHEEPLPVVWSHTRYQRSNITDGKLFTSLDHHPPLFTVLRHGYVIAIADVRGAGASYGTKHGWFPPEEAEDAHDLTEWFAEQPWSNGRVGMMNRSYLGITQYFNASQAPPHLACIFPEVAWIDEYDFIYPGGIFLDWPAYSWSIMVEAADRSAALPENWRTIVAENRVREADASPYAGTDYVTAAPEGGDPGGPVVPVDEDVDGHFLAEATAEHKASVPGHAIGVDLPFRDSVDAHTGAAYHEQRSLYGRLADIARSKVPAYHLGGWFDGFARDTLLWFRNYPNEQKLVMGPWFHGGITGINMPAEYLRWFDRWLKQVDNHVLDEASMHYWRLKSPAGTEWRGTDVWPLATEQRRAFHFHGGPSGSIESVNDGVLAHAPAGSPAADAYRVDYTTSSGIDNRWTWTAGGGTQAEIPKPPSLYPYPDMQGNDRRGLTYTSAPLETAVEVTGHPVVHLWVTSTASDGDFFVYLEDIELDGRSVYVSEGQLRASHRRLAEPPYDRMGLPYHRSHAEDVLPLVTDTPAELVFDLQPTSMLFRVGHRMRITVTCTDKDTFTTPVLDPPPTVQVLRSAEHPSRVVLPIIPATPATSG